MLKLTLVLVLILLVAGAFIYRRPASRARIADAPDETPLDLRIERPATIPDDPSKLCKLVLEPLWAPLKAVGYERDEQLNFLNRLTRGQQLIFYAWILDGEVGNGGWSAVYYNSTGDFAPEIRAALQELGAKEHAAIFDRVEALAPGGQMSTDRSERERQYDRLGDAGAGKLSELDDDYFALSKSGHDLMRFAADYITAHPDDFFR